MATTMKDLGTVLDYTGKKGRMVTTDRNEQGTKRIIVNLYNKKDEKWKVVCSDAVTQLLRAGDLAVGQLPSLTIMCDEDLDPTDKDTVSYICLPQGNEIVYKIEDLKLRPYEAKEVSKEDYLVL